MHIILCVLHNSGQGDLQWLDLYVEVVCVLIPLLDEKHIAYMLYNHFCSFNQGYSFALVKATKEDLKVLRLFSERNESLFSFWLLSRFSLAALFCGLCREAPSRSLVLACTAAPADSFGLWMSAFFR